MIRVNIPNILSIFRMCLVPVFVMVFFSDEPNSNLLAAGVYALAGITDVLDGIIARKFNQITPLGKILDPLADKLMTITVFICISIAGIIPWWIIALIFAKDALLIAGGVKLYKEVSGVFSANILGKTATVFLVVGGILIMTLGNHLPGLIKDVFLYLAVMLSLLAFLSYLYQYYNFKKSQK